MKIGKTAGVFFLIVSLSAPPAWSFTAVKDSSEDLFWSDPMTVHDYKKKSDLHSITISAMALSELQFVRLGDGLINLTARNNRSPISRSLDSLEYAYSRLPRVEPVRRVGQLFDALQLRQVSLSDARVLGSFLTGGLGGITPLMQVRVYKLVVFVEDVIDGLDRAVMFPVNWGTSSLREKPTRVKTLGYAGDGLGFLRWHFSAGLKYVSKEVARLGSNAIMTVEKWRDSNLRRKQKKLHGKMPIYSRMPVEVFLKNRSLFTGKKSIVSAGTLTEWQEKIFTQPELLPDDLKKAELQIAQDIATKDPSQELILSCDYLTWEKTPRELKKYVITPEEFTELIRARDSVPSPAAT